MIGDFAPKLVELTDDVLSADVWERKDLSKRVQPIIRGLLPNNRGPWRVSAELSQDAFQDHGIKKGGEAGMDLDRKFMLRDWNEVVA